MLSQGLLLLLTSSELYNAARGQQRVGPWEGVTKFALWHCYKSIFLLNDRVYCIRGIPVRNNAIDKQMTERTSDIRITKARTVSNVSVTVWVLLYTLTSFHTSGPVWWSGPIDPVCQPYRFKPTEPVLPGIGIQTTGPVPSVPSTAIAMQASALAGRTCLASLDTWLFPQGPPGSVAT